LTHRYNKIKQLIGDKLPKAFGTTEAFVATLSVDKEVPPVQTQATGTAGFTQPHLNNMSYGI
jgi:hypothetical protein